MNPARREILQLLAGAAALPALASSARAQAWPARPVRIIVPFQPGGSTDIFARLAAQKLTEHFGKQFYVENIAGATGNVGTAQAARAAPDGLVTWRRSRTDTSSGTACRGRYGVRHAGCGNRTPCARSSK